jgi:hypothetical protein
MYKKFSAAAQEALKRTAASDARIREPAQQALAQELNFPPRTMYVS